MSEIWLRTDEREDAIASLKLYLDTLSKVHSDIVYWKWVIVSLHSAVQSMMAFHLGFGNHLLVMTQEDAEAWLEAHESGTGYPDSKMDSFLNLYKKIKKHKVRGYKFSPSSQQGGSIKKLNWFRNEFVHFMPKGWSIEMTEMPSICLDNLNIIKSLNDGPAGKRWENEVQASVFSSLLAEAMGRTNENYR